MQLALMELGKKFRPREKVSAKGKSFGQETENASNTKK
jgi:hypothetical protein